MTREPFVSLSSLESDLRSRLEGEVRELEARRARLERDARAADEFVRRVSSMMPGPSGAAVALFPSLAAVRGAGVAPEPSGGAAPAHPPAVLRPRPHVHAGLATALAVVMSLAALFVSTGHRAEIASASASEVVLPSRYSKAPPCSDALPAPTGAASIASSSAPFPVLAPSRPAAVKAPGPAARMRASTDAVPKATTAGAPAVEAGAKLEEAARTAAILRDQLSTTLH